MNKQENSGIKAFPYDAANLSNGVYFFCIKAGNIMETKNNDHSKIATTSESFQFDPFFPYLSPSDSNATLLLFVLYIELHIELRNIELLNIPTKPFYIRLRT
jgi:hypothetical protein